MTQCRTGCTYTALFRSCGGLTKYGTSIQVSNCESFLVYMVLRRRECAHDVLSQVLRNYRSSLHTHTLTFRQVLAVITSERERRDLITHHIMTKLERYEAIVGIYTRTDVLQLE